MYLYNSTLFCLVRTENNIRTQCLVIRVYYVCACMDVHMHIYVKCTRTICPAFALRTNSSLTRVARFKSRIRYQNSSTQMASICCFAGYTHETLLFYSSTIDTRQRVRTYVRMILLKIRTMSMHPIIMHGPHLRRNEEPETTRNLKELVVYETE